MDQASNALSSPEGKALEMFIRQNTKNLEDIKERVYRDLPKKFEVGGLSETIYDNEVNRGLERIELLEERIALDLDLLSKLKRKDVLTKSECDYIEKIKLMARQVHNLANSYN